MATLIEKTCACKGVRSCLLCENMKQTETESKNAKSVFYYCYLCGNKAWTSSNHSDHSVGRGDISLTINGVFVKTEVISEEEEADIVERIDAESSRWILSQSGRRKQDFGPKVNFKKKVCKMGNFVGIPRYAHNVFKRFSIEYASLLSDFLPVELCNLEYVPERGSAIDPHLDDTWLWGERLITLNLLSETVLTLTKVPAHSTDEERNVEIAIALPARSLLVLFGEARHLWFHSIRREHIKARRIAMTWRELTAPFMPEGQHYESIGKPLLEVARNEI